MKLLSSQLPRYVFSMYGMSGWILRTANGWLQAANLPREKGSKRGQRYSDMLQLQMGSSQDEDVFLLLTTTSPNVNFPSESMILEKGSHLLRRPVDLRSFHPKVPHKFEQRARPISTSKWRMRHLTRWRCSRKVPKEQTKLWIDFGNMFFAAGDLSTFTTHM